MSAKLVRSSPLFCIALVSMLGFVGISAAQNLSVNNSFESFSALPAGPGEWWKVNSWNNVNNQAVFAWPYASPDYLSVNGSGQAKLPNSIFGTVTPFSGNAVMGIVTYYNPGAADFREYLSQTLNSPLVAGQTYTVSFMMTNGFSNQYCGSGSNHIGVHFSLSPLSQLQHEPINVVPQCEISGVWWNTSWQQVSFTFTPTAAFRYMTIGNFYNDASTTHTVFNAAANSSYGAYYFIDEVVVQQAVPLPVNLLSFQGENVNNMVRLFWTTASEFENDHFEVQRSGSATDFKNIGIVSGNGTSSVIHDYEFTDLHPISGITYYRLKQVDFNGEYQYSATIAVKRDVFGYSPFLSASSDPGVYSLHFASGHESTIRILDASGRTLQVILPASDQNELLLDFRNRPPGFFFISIISEAGPVTLKVAR